MASKTATPSPLRVYAHSFTTNNRFVFEVFCKAMSNDKPFGLVQSLMGEPRHSPQRGGSRYNGGNPTPVASTFVTSAQRWLRNALPWEPAHGGGSPRPRCFTAARLRTSLSQLAYAFVIFAIAFAIFAIAFVISAIAFAILATGFAISATGFAILATGFAISATGFVILATAFVILATGFVILATGFVILAIAVTNLSRNNGQIQIIG
ncbi:hypothetical protein [Tolypothrix sp. VBCCA 56010]|uniref:hypothetical protein n=1 Tax=Tolypothrix sp. VBCCA 56010 TaxID=3137731 RepID=UPI003D7E0A97